MSAAPVVSVSDACLVLALDFDGVLCDGRREYFEAARRAYAAAWPGARPERAAGVSERFAALRPLIESGWEMPLLLHALIAGEPAAALADRGAWRVTGARLLATAAVDAQTLGRALNDARDEWFARDPDDWVRQHVFYPGVIAQLIRLAEGPLRIVVVTTKAARFARALLAAQDAGLGALAVVGHDPGRAVPKTESLARLAAGHALVKGAGLWFVEDLLDTLDAVHAQPGLGGARLFLAAWGYNTLEHRASLAWRPAMSLLSLAAFTGPLGGW